MKKILLIAACSLLGACASQQSIDEMEQMHALNPSCPGKVERDYSYTIFDADEKPNKTKIVTRCEPAVVPSEFEKAISNGDLR